MTWYLANVFVHIMCAILWIGDVLFWIILVGPLERRVGGAEAARVLAKVNAAPWPPHKIPSPVRIAFSQVPWMLFLVLAATGVVMILHRGFSFGDLATGAIFGTAFGRVLGPKLAVVAVVAVLQLRLGRRPGRTAVYTTAGAALALIILSAALARVVTP